VNTPDHDKTDSSYV